MSLGRILGYVILTLVVLGIAAGVATKQKWIKNEKLAAFVAKHHRLFAYVAILVALVHAIYNFSMFGPNILGALTLITLIGQAVVGTLATKPGAKPILGFLHLVLPGFFVVFVLIHIFA